jgi:SAM-dependent methyltransferase
LSTPDSQFDFLTWQKDVWDAMSRAYVQEVDPRLAPVADGVVRRAKPRANVTILDLGCGTGSVAIKLAAAGAHVRAIDISEAMIRIASARAERAGFDIRVEEGRAEHIPALDASFDTVVASLSLMFVSDKAAAAGEIARVLRSEGHFVASVWGPPDQCDIVRFQRLVGSFAPEPPVKGVGPGAMADPTIFLELLKRNDVAARVQQEVVTWGHPNLQHAWDTFTNVTALRMSAEQQVAARAAIVKDMWPDPGAPRTFHNLVQYIVGFKR